MTDDKQTEQPANENERRSEDELRKEFLRVSFYNMLRSVAGLAHYAGMQAWKKAFQEVLHSIKSQWPKKCSRRESRTTKFSRMRKSAPSSSKKSAKKTAHPYTETLET